MSPNDSHYPEFVPNQILTNKQLNDLRAYLAGLDRRTRIRLTGTGIVYGLSWSVEPGDDESGQIVIDKGFGVTSDGYLIELEKPTTYTHYRRYEDPDVDEDAEEEGMPRYTPWRDGNLPIWELLDIDTMMAEEPPKRTTRLKEKLGTQRVLVLYLEKESVALKSCLVTDCSNKGRNIRFNVRALLVDKNIVEYLALAPDLLVRIPRLTGLENVESVKDLRNIYAEIVGGKADDETEDGAENKDGTEGEVGAAGAADQLRKAFRLTFDNYAGILELDPPDLAFLRGMTVASAGEGTFGHFQYRYDVLKDLACAHREFVVAAAERIASRRPEKDFGRHLMLGAVDRTEGYRHEFMPSPAVGDLERVRKLFERIVAMVKAVDYEGATEVRITPSHTEAHALGKRAVPYYYGLTPGIKDRWQPKLSRTAERLWSYHNSADQLGRIDLDFDYNRCSFLRIEGYRRLPYDQALEKITALRSAYNLEFEVLCSYLKDPDPDDLSLDDYRSALATGLRTLRDHLYDVVTKDNVSFNWGLASRDGDGLIGLDTTLLNDYAGWIDLRQRRKLHCDLRDLQAGYLATRNAVLCVLHGLLGELKRMAEVLDRSISEETPQNQVPLVEGWEVEVRLLAGVKKTASDRLAVRITALRTEPVDQPPELKLLIDNLPEAPLWVAWRASVDALSDGVAALIEDRFPKDLRAFSYPLFLDKYQEIVAGVVHLGLLAHLGRVAGPGGVSVLPPELGEIAAGLSNWAGTCCHSRLAALYSAYEHRRRTDPSLFANLVGSVDGLEPLAGVDGLEHLAGVEKGGTFVLVCEERPLKNTDSELVAQDADSEIRALADFSLAGRVPCCCEAEQAEICLPPMALADSRIVALDIASEGLDIRVLVDDFDPNFERESGGGPKGSLNVGLPADTSAFGATLDLVGDEPVIQYTLVTPVAGVIDHFFYTLSSEHTSDSEHGTCLGAAMGGVLVLLVPKTEEQQETATLTVRVVEVIDGVEFGVNDASVSLRHGSMPGDPPVSIGDGFFKFEGLMVGETYTVQAFFGQRSSPPRDVELPSGGVEVKLILSSVPLEKSEILGVVYLKPAENDERLSNVAVQLLWPGTTDGTTLVTNAEGFYRFPNLQPYDENNLAILYSVIVRGDEPKSADLTTARPRRFDFELKGNWEMGNVHVFLRFQGTNTLTADAKVILDDLSIYNEDKDSPQVNKITNAFEFNGVPARRSYDVNVDKDGYTETLTNIKCLVKDPANPNIFLLAAGETVEVWFELKKSSRFAVSDDLVAIVAAHRKLSSAAAQAKVEEVCGGRHDSRLATLAEIGEDAALRRSVAYQSGERFLTETLADAGLGDDGVIAAFEEFSERLVKTIRSAAAERKPPYRTLFRSVSLGLMDWLVLNHPETLSPESKAALTEMVRNLRQARAGLEKLRQGWDGAALARELGVTTVDDVHEALR